MGITVEHIEEQVRLATQILQRIPGLRRIWLFGSGGRGESLDWRSDLDLAVEGMPAEMHCRIWAELDERLQVPIDLVRWETANAVLRQEIQRGRLLYAAALRI